ncbi:MAG: ATP-binding protein [Halothiobacillaceae bacterium]
MTCEQHLRLAPRTDELPKLAEAIEHFAEEQALDPSLAMQLNLVLDELLTNIATHGSAHPEQPVTWVEVTLLRANDRLEITLADDGPQFDPREAPAPDLDADVEARKIGGLGLHFVRHFTDRMHYAREDGQNILTLHKQLAAD